MPKHKEAMSSRAIRRVDSSGRATVYAAALSAINYSRSVSRCNTTESDDGDH